MRLFIAFSDRQAKRSCNVANPSGRTVSFSASGDQLSFLARQYLTRNGRDSGTRTLTRLSVSRELSTCLG